VHWLDGAVGVVAWAGFWLLVDRISGRGRKTDPLERLDAYEPDTVADEAEAWLRGQ
jgi:hypothetical protein